MTHPNYSWIEAVRRIRDRHGYGYVSLKTGHLIKKEGCRYISDILDTIHEDNEVRADELLEERLKGCDAIMVDAVTANMLCTVYDALGEKNRALFDNQDIVVAVNIGWRCVK